MSILPPEVRAGYVYNRVLRAIGDRPEDEDRFPDGIPAKGTVTFTPKNSVKQVVSNSTGVTVTREPVVCTIHQGEAQYNDPDPDKAGMLIDEAGAVGGVWLVVGEWTVSYQFEDRYSSVPNQDIVVTEDHTEDNPLDVALVAGLTPSPTIKFVVNEQVYVDTLKARDETIAARDLVLPARDQTLAARDQTLAHGITVDTSVGTRVFVGDTMIHGDTGRRDIRDSHVAPETVEAGGRAWIQRTDNTVRVSLYDLSFSTSGTVRILMTLPLGFRPIDREGYSLSVSRQQTVESVIFSTGLFIYGAPTTGGRVNATIAWGTADPWPTALPGTPL